MLNSFNTAAACYIVTTQLQHVFGIYTQNKEKRNFFKIIFVSINVEYLLRLIFFCNKREGL